MRKLIIVLDSVIYWAIVLIPFSVAIAPAWTHTLTAFLFVFFITKKILKKEPFFKSNILNMPFIFLAIISLFSFKNSIDYQASIRGIFKLFQNGVIFLICAEEIKDSRQVLRIVISAALGILLSVSDALWQLQSGKDFIRGNNLIINIGLRRATAAFPNANVFGVYLSAITPLTAATALFYFKGVKRTLMLFISGLAALGIMLTFSRGAILALYLSVLFLAIFKKDKLLIFSLVILLSISPFIAPKSVKGWAKECNYNPLVFMLNADRVSIYKNALNMIRQHPLIGVGVNTFSKNYLTYKLPEPENARSADFMYAHNIFLQMAGEIGLLGLGAFIWLLIRFFGKSVYIYKKLKDSFLKTVSLSLMACVIAFLINGLTETSLYYSRVAMIFWFILGFSLSLEKFTAADAKR